MLPGLRQIDLSAQQPGVTNLLSRVFDKPNGANLHIPKSSSETSKSTITTAAKSRHVSSVCEG